MKTIGVLGGMGPEATNQFCAWITALTPAQRDQDHVPVLCFNNSQVPDRTAAILKNGASPLAELIRSALLLEQAGADFLVMPCNTAHYYYDEVVASIQIPFLHMPREVVRHARARCPQGKRLGLLSTTGTQRTGVYAGPVHDEGFELILPNEVEQEQWVTVAIKAIKAGDKEKAKSLLIEAAEALAARGAELLIAGCTEIPLALKQADLTLPLIDPAEILARLAVARARDV